MEENAGHTYVLPMHILVIEDDHPLRASIARGLREASHLVDEAATGSDGLSLAATGRFDAVVLDILLPGMDGVEVCRQLRAQENWVPVLILTALDSVEQRITGLNAGADDYLGKPFDFGELLARLHALTRRRGPGVPAEIRVGDLHVDTRKRLVHRGSRAIELTAREFDFLLCLTRNAGRVVSRTELLTDVWNDAGHTHSNVIDVYASRLRRKIDEGESIALVTTLRGVGYMIDLPSANPPGERGTGPERDRD